MEKRLVVMKQDVEEIKRVLNLLQEELKENKKEQCR